MKTDRHEVPVIERLDLAGKYQVPQAADEFIELAPPENRV